MYQNHLVSYDISLDCRFPVQEVIDVAEQAEVTFRVTYYRNTNFGQHDLDMVFINPDPHIEMGRQPSLFPESNVIYSSMDVASDIKLQYFTLLSENEVDADRVSDIFSQYGAKVIVTRNEPVKFHVAMLFSTLNLSFFSLLALLLLFCIASYYVQRMKEIGIRKLYGWNGREITLHLIVPLLKQIYVAVFFVVLLAAGYILLQDAKMLETFLTITIWMCFFLALVFLIAAFGGLWFIYKVDRVAAIKNRRNNKLIFIFLLAFKVIATVLLILSMSTTLTKVFSLRATTIAIDELIEYDFYKIATPVVPEASLAEQFTSMIEACPDEGIFNYAVTSTIYSNEKLKTAQLMTAEEQIPEERLSFTSCSANLLFVFDLFEENGKKLSAEDFPLNSTILLVPHHYQTELSVIMEYLAVPQDTTVIYLQDGQTQHILTQPGYYTFDSIYLIEPLKKAIYLNNGEVLLTTACAELLESNLLSVEADGTSIRIESQNIEYGIFKGNTYLALWESLFRVIINLASFILCAIAVATIFLELRKKEIGVFRLLGRYPYKSLGLFAGVNLTSTVVVAAVVRPLFLVLIVLEGLLYCTLIGIYLRQKAILVLKGA